MKTVALLPVLFVLLVGATPANAWTWPADGPVLQPFHLGDDPYAAGQHRGIDVAGVPGSAARAPAGGVVSFAGSVPGGGRTLTIRTADGYAVTLLHLGSVGVRRGAAIAEGTTVGTIGSSGTPEHDEPYVHLGIRSAADAHGYVDPLALLPGRADPPAEPAPPTAPEVPAEGSEPEAGAEAPTEAPAAPAPAPAPDGQPAAQSESTSEPTTDSRAGSGREARAPAEELPVPAEHSLPEPAESKAASAESVGRNAVLRTPARADELPAPIRRSERALLEGGSATAYEPVPAPEGPASDGQGPGTMHLVGAALAFLLALGAALAAALRAGRLHRGRASRAKPVAERVEAPAAELQELEIGPEARPPIVPIDLEPCRLEHAWLGVDAEGLASVPRADVGDRPARSAEIEHAIVPLRLHEIAHRRKPKPRPLRSREAPRRHRVRDPRVGRRRPAEQPEFHAVSIR